MKQKSIDSAVEGRTAYYITLTSSDGDGKVRKTKKGDVLLGVFDVLSKKELKDKGVQLLDVKDLRDYYENNFNPDSPVSNEDFMEVDIYKHLILFVKKHPNDVIMVDEFPIIGTKSKLSNLCIYYINSKRYFILHSS